MDDEFVYVEEQGTVEVLEKELDVLHEKRAEVGIDLLLLNNEKEIEIKNFENLSVHTNQEEYFKNHQHMIELQDSFFILMIRSEELENKMEVIRLRMKEIKGELKKKFQSKPVKTTRKWIFKIPDFLRRRKCKLDPDDYQNSAKQGAKFFDETFEIKDMEDDPDYTFVESQDIIPDEVIIITAYDDFESIAAKKMERRDDAIARLGEIEVLIEDFHEKLIKLVNDDDIPKKYLDKIDSLQEKAGISAKLDAIKDALDDAESVLRKTDQMTRIDELRIRLSAVNELRGKFN